MMDVKYKGVPVDVLTATTGTGDAKSAIGTPHQLSDQYTCPRCSQTFHVDEKSQHEDWHFAGDLQAQEQNGATSPEPQSQPASTIQPLSSKQGRDSKEFQPPSYAPPSHPPPSHAASTGYAPPSHPHPRNATNGAATHTHTNQVIEAAKIRARDEVNLETSSLCMSSGRLIISCSNKCKTRYKISNFSTESTTVRSSLNMRPTIIAIVLSTTTRD